MTRRFPPPWFIVEQGNLGMRIAAVITLALVVPVGNSNPAMLTVRSAQNGRDDDMAHGLDGVGIGASLHRDR